MPKRSDPLTQRAQNVLTSAHDEALRLQHPAIDTEHILYGLLQEQASLATQMLIGAGLDLQYAREQLQTYLQHSNQPVSTELDYAPRGLAVLKHAHETAQRLGLPDIGTEHLLLGLLQVEDGVAASILTSQGLQARTLYNDVMLHLDREHTSTLPQQVVPLSIGAMLLAGVGTAAALLLRKQHAKAG